MNSIVAPITVETTHPKLKVLVVGNCQARPLAHFLERAGRFDCLMPIILHLANADELDSHYDKIKQADIVLAQQTAPNFALPHLRSSTLQDIHPRTIIWPNLFYSGEQPFLRYITHHRGGRLLGPLDALHDLRYYLRWRNARGYSSPPNFPADFVERVSQLSLTELRVRESACDIGISDVVQAHTGTEPLFFTFNHPTNRVLWELMRRILRTLGEPDNVPFDASLPEALGRYVVPSTWTTAETVFQGDNIVKDPETGHLQRVPGPPKSYNAPLLEQLFFDMYDQNSMFKDIENLRFTPDMPVDKNLVTGSAQ